MMALALRLWLKKSTKPSHRVLSLRGSFFLFPDSSLLRVWRSSPPVSLLLLEGKVIAPPSGCLFDLDADPLLLVVCLGSRDGVTFRLKPVRAAVLGFGPLMQTTEGQQWPCWVTSESFWDIPPFDALGVSLCLRACTSLSLLRRTAFVGCVMTAI